MQSLGRGYALCAHVSELKTGCALRLTQRHCRSKHQVEKIVVEVWERAPKWQKSDGDVYAFNFGEHLAVQIGELDLVSRSNLGQHLYA
eukprot:3105492-Prymnesium_polylepis.1